MMENVCFHFTVINFYAVSRNGHFVSAGGVSISSLLCFVWAVCIISRSYFCQNRNIFIHRSSSPVCRLTLEAADFSVMRYYTAVQEKELWLYIFKKLSLQAPVAFIDDILMAFGRRVNCMLFHNRVDGI